jgi:hypothetical protein
MKYARKKIGKENENRKKQNEIFVMRHRENI